MRGNALMVMSGHLETGSQLCSGPEGMALIYETEKKQGTPFTVIIWFAVPGRAIINAQFAA
jgi:hypothetical protein